MCKESKIQTKSIQQATHTKFTLQTAALPADFPLKYENPKARNRISLQLPLFIIFLHDILQSAAFKFNF